MKIERTDQILTISETPGCLWIFGLFFALIGSAFVYGALGGYSNYDQITAIIIAAHTLGGLSAIAAGYWIIYQAPVTRITIDRSSETVTCKKRGLSGKSNVTYTFDRIKKFTLIEQPDSDGDPTFALGMELDDGELISISALFSPVETYKRDFAFQANEFLYKQMPSYRAEYELEDES